jgi:O-acetyl-ADP-ribose deacetylase (regulator of RNase III)
MSGQVELVTGSIAEEDADVIVNSANTDMIMGSGVAEAIHGEAGSEVEEEAMAQAPVAVGDVVVTSGGNMAVKHIVHVAVVGDTEPDLYECTRNALDAAAELRATSLSLPALGTGSAGMSPRESARDMLRAIRDHIEETGSDLYIRIVLWDEELYPLFQRRLERTFAHR